MSLDLRARLKAIIEPPVLSDSRQSTTLNSYVASWVIILAMTPILIAFYVALPPLRHLIAIIGPALLVATVSQLIIIRSGLHSVIGFVPTVLGWAAITWTAWVTGGIYSPSISAQFVIVILAVGWGGRGTGLLLLGLSTLAIAGMGWAQAVGVVPQSELAFSPTLYAAIVATYLIAIALLEGVLSRQMRAVQIRLGIQLDERLVAERRLREVIDNAPFGAFVCEIIGGEPIITQANLSASLVLGTDASRFVGCNIECAFPGASDRTLSAQVRRIAENGGMHDSGAVPFVSAGEPRVLDLHAFQIEEGLIAAFFTDVTEKRAAEVEIHQMALHDELTQLPNRNMLKDRLESALAAAQHRGSHVALLFIDIDNFKLINDEFGHVFGDQVLFTVAQRLRGCARSTDTVARLGGDEFVIIAADLDGIDQAVVLARKAVECLHEPLVIGGRGIAVSVSVGVSMSDDDQSPSTLLERGDAAMYQAKRAGRDGFQLYQSQRP